MHSRLPHFAYAVTRLKFRSTGPDGKTAMVKMKKGEYSSGGASSHAVENYLPGVMPVVEVKLTFALPTSPEPLVQIRRAWNQYGWHE